MADYDVGAAFAAIENELIASMMRNFSRHRAEETAEGFQWSQWQAEMLDGLGEYKRSATKRYGTQFQSINSKLEAEIRSAYAQGGAEQEEAILGAIRSGFSARSRADTLGGSFFRVNERKLDALINATVSDMEQAETAILRRANDQYRKIIFNAQVYANTGAGTYEKAVDMATKDFLANGIQCVVYKNGARHTLSDYADMALRTASKRAYLQGEGAKRQEWGIPTVIINKRNGACPDCAKFCGRVFIDDVWSGGTRSDGDYPLLSSAIAQGLYHPRCKDSHTTYFPELYEDEKPYTKAEIAQLEQNEQREQREQYAQRQAEKYRRLEQFSLDPENKRKYGQRAREWERVSEQSKRKYTYQKTVVSREIELPQYRRKLDLLGEETRITRAIWQKSVEMLHHRSGTRFEDLAYIDSKTGKFLVRTDYDVELQCVPSRAMRRKLASSPPYTIIGIHNHPGSSVPSVADLKAAQQGKYKYGVIVCHNGVIYKYSVSEQAKFEIANILLDDIQRCVYNMDTESLRNLLEQLELYGVHLEVF